MTITLPGTADAPSAGTNDSTESSAPSKVRRFVRGRDTDPTGQIKQLQPVAEQHVILRHATRSSPLGGEETSLSRKADSAQPRLGAVTLTDLSNPRLSGELGDSPR